MRDGTLAARRRLYLLARVVVARHYGRPLTLEVVGRALACSPRQLQRAYEQFGEITFQEDLRARRMAAAAELLAEQRSIPVADVARLVGYRQGAHFARAFARSYGLTPAGFRRQARHGAEAPAAGPARAPRHGAEARPVGPARIPRQGAEAPARVG